MSLMGTEPIWPGRFLSVHLRFSRGVITIAVVVVVLAVGDRRRPLPTAQARRPVVVPEAYCTVRTPVGDADLDIEQAQVSATIAAVAARRKLPERAVVIAYATALQESKLLQPRVRRPRLGRRVPAAPVAGLGHEEADHGPVYATNKFFAALVKVKDYRKLPLAEAAQAVQRSADGEAYAPHEEEAKLLAAAFTGRVPKAVHCWYPPEAGQSATPRPRAGEARRQLARALGSTSITTQRRGWLVAAWSVAHAQKYGLRRVTYSGATWSNDMRLTGGSRAARRAPGRSSWPDGSGGAADDGDRAGRQRLGVAGRPGGALDAFEGQQPPVGGAVVGEVEQAPLGHAGDCPRTGTRRCPAPAGRTRRPP